MNVTASQYGPDSAVSIRNLRFQYDRTPELALCDVDLEIPAGCCFGLLGPNGAGKTTLLSILTGILPCQEGEVVVAGQSVSAGQVKELSAMVPQDFAFYPDLTGRENLVFFAGLHGLRGAAREGRVAGAVEVCQLGEVLDKRAGTYSGGLKRRLNLAIGLLNKPDILYLDEPTVGIDAQSRNFILEAIQALKEQGMTIVYTSHYMEEVQAICDEIAIIDHGKVVVRNSLAALLDEQEHVVQLTLDQTPTERQIAGLAALDRCRIEGRRLSVDLAESRMDVQDLLEQLKAANLIPRQIQYGINRLEDIYLSITSHELRE